MRRQKDLIPAKIIRKIITAIEKFSDLRAWIQMLIFRPIKKVLKSLKLVNRNSPKG